MRIMAILSIVCVLGVATSHSQINEVVGGFDKVVGTKFPRLDHGARPFIGEFRFAAMPLPLQAVRVDFTLTVCYDYRYIGMDPWPIRIQWDSKALAVIGDTLFQWPGQHSLEDQFSGSFEVMPLMSGSGGFSMYLDKLGFIDGKLGVKWCIDIDGGLTYLDKLEPKQAPIECTQCRCVFFDETDIHVVQREDPSDLFHTEYKITPPFKAGDTSKITYTLTALEDIEDSLSIHVVAEGMTVVSIDQPAARLLKKGDMLALTLHVVPLLRTGVPGITVRVAAPMSETKSDSRCYSIMPCYYILNEDGTLRCISDEHLYLDDTSVLAKDLPPIEKGDNELINMNLGDGSVSRYVY